MTQASQYSWLFSPPHNIQPFFQLKEKSLYTISCCHYLQAAILCVCVFVFCYLYTYILFGLFFVLQKTNHKELHTPPQKCDDILMF